MLCAFSAFAEFRTLPEGEAQAFRALYGTDDMQKLTEIEVDPQAYWREREEYLTQSAHKAIPHVQFCERFVQEAKECLEQKCVTSDIESVSHAVDCAIKDSVPEDSPLFPNVRAMLYGELCEKAQRYPKFFECFLGANDLRKRVQHCVSLCSEIVPVTHDFNARVCWQILPNGQPSMFDSLVMSSKGFFLCSAPEGFDERFAFCAHDRQFSGWVGIFIHDVLTHAMEQYKAEKDLKDHGISSQNLFDACCNPDALSVGNLMTLSRQIQGWYYHFHEHPSYMPSPCPDLYNYIFKKSLALSDPEFQKVTPYFMCADLDDNWRDNPLRKMQVKNEEVDGFLQFFRWQFCRPIIRFLPESAAWSYINDAAYLHEYIDSRACLALGNDTSLRHFFQGIDQTCREDNVKSMAQKFKEALQSVQTQDQSLFEIYAPIAVCFKVVTTSAKELKRLEAGGHKLRFKKRQHPHRIGLFDKKKASPIWLMPEACAVGEDNNDAPLSHARL